MPEVKLNHLIVFVAITVALAPSHASATTYRFTVSCQHQRFVAQWNVGDIDPGKEYLRVTTGTKFPGCGISDFNPSADGDLPVERYSHEGAVIQGVPLVGPIICGIFGC